MTDTRTPSFTADEMEAIRGFCEWFAHRHGTEADMRRVLRDEAHLPERVIEWIVAGCWCWCASAVLGESPVPCQTCGGSGIGMCVDADGQPVGYSECPTCRGEQ